MNRKELSLIERDKKAIKKVGKPLAIRVLEVVDKGLCYGVGKPIPGEMCVEAAVCYAMGQEHGDNPSCVSDDIQELKILLNDKKWPSKKVRAEGMRRIAVAQLGSDMINGKLLKNEFMNIVLMKVILPVLKKHDDKAVAAFAKRMSAKMETKDRIKMLHKGYYEFDLYFPFGPSYYILNVLKQSITFISTNTKMSYLDNLKLHAICIEKTLIACKTKGSKYLYLCNKK